MIGQDQLMAIFQYMASEKSVVNLYSTYRGLPLDTDTAITGVRHGEITTKVFGYQAVSMAVGGHTYLKAAQLPGTIKATVVNVDIKKKQALLSDFSDAVDSIGNRRMVRVEPGERLEVNIYDGRQHLQGKVADLCSEGLCIYTLFADTYGMNFQRDKKVLIDFGPPFIKFTLRSSGIITSIHSYPGSFQRRLGVKINTNEELRSLLDEYIQRRQKEIMNEMEQQYLLLRGKKRIKGLLHVA